MLSYLKLPLDLSSRFHVQVAELRLKVPRSSHPSVEWLHLHHHGASKSADDTLRTLESFGADRYSWATPEYLAFCGSPIFGAEFFPKWFSSLHPKTPLQPDLKSLNSSQGVLDSPSSQCLATIWLVRLHCFRARPLLPKVQRLTQGHF